MTSKIELRKMSYTFSLNSKFMDEYLLEVSLLGLDRNEFLKILYEYYKDNKDNEVFKNKIKKIMVKMYGKK